MKSAMLLLSSLLIFQAFATDPVIYGEDDRKDVFESSDALLVELSKSTAAMIESTLLKPIRSKGTTAFSIGGRSLEDSGVCPEERFSQQPAIAHCSGFLVSERHIVSAGHCFESQGHCENFKWIFDFKVTASDQKSVVVKPSSIYSCKKILAHANDIMAKNDYVLIELDRPVADRQPLPFRKEGKPSPGQPLAVIGHPNGLPTKIADNAIIRSTSENFFTANLDTFQVNSGSPVINLITGVVEGILVRGDTDYDWDGERECKVVRSCSDSGCNGEEATYITNIPGLPR